MLWAEYLNMWCWNRWASGGTSCPPRCVFPWPAWTWLPMWSRGVRAWRTWAREPPGHIPGSRLQGNSSSLQTWSSPTTTCTTCTLCVTTTGGCTEDIIQVVTEFLSSGAQIGPPESSECQLTTFQSCAGNLFSFLFNPVTPRHSSYAFSFFSFWFYWLWSTTDTRLILTSSSWTDISHTTSHIGKAEISVCTFYWIQDIWVYCSCNGFI